MTQLRFTTVWMLGLFLAAACGGGTPRLTELETVTAGSVQVVLLSDHNALRHGKDSFVLEFRSDPGNAPVDVGTVKATANMPMPGMPMFGTIDVRRTSVIGRYDATGEFSMAGRWRLAVEWDGPAGRGSVSFSGNVQ
jgi:YtkA-like